MSEPEVVDNTDRSRYEILVDGQVAGYSRYALAGDTVAFNHTEIDMDYEGQGLGGKLVAGALDDVRAQGRKMTATCPFVREYLKRHPEYADLKA